MKATEQYFPVVLFIMRSHVATVYAFLTAYSLSHSLIYSLI